MNLDHVRQRADWLCVNRQADDTITGYVLFAAALASADDVPPLLELVDSLTSENARLRAQLAGEVSGPASPGAGHTPEGGAS